MFQWHIVAILTIYGSHKIGQYLDSPGDIKSLLHVIRQSI